MTDTSATEATAATSDAAPAACCRRKGPGHFFPYWTQARVDGQCVWEFGNMRNGNTFGRDRQWGRVGPNTRGAFVSRIRPVPECG